MATFLDVSGLENFSNIFVFLFVWIIVYAILLYSKVLGGNKFVHVLIGLILGIFVLFSDLATRIVLNITPWFAIIFVFVILITVAASMFGHPADMQSYMGLKWILLVFIVIAVIVSAFVEVRQSVSVP